MSRITKTKADEDRYYVLARIYVQDPLGDAANVILSQAHVHYLRNVLRKEQGEQIRMFNGRDGEWVCNLTDLRKKNGTAQCQIKIREQRDPPRRVRIYVSPLKKTPFDTLIQKSVELGVTDIHPVLYPRSTTRNINAERVRAHIIEAAEQCESLSLPVLHDVVPMDQMIKSIDQNIDVFAAIERHDVQVLKQDIISKAADIAFIIGPEGGFSDDDIMALSKISQLKPVNLGELVLRAETAVLKCLALSA